MRYLNLLREDEHDWYVQLASDIWNYIETISPEEKAKIRPERNDKEKLDSFMGYLWRFYVALTKTDTWAGPDELAANMAANDYKQDQVIYKQIRQYLDTPKENE